MKQLYAFVYASIFIGVLFSAKKMNAQCNCGHGVQATPISYTVTMGSTTSSNNIISFPKFDAALGTLRCVNFTATISGTTTTTVINTAGQNRYRFLLALTPQIEGPGFSTDQTYDKTYGPDSLYDQHYIDSANYGTNTITYGPDDIFLNTTMSATVNNQLSAYMTSDPVNITYSISGGLITTSGGANYTATITTVTSGSFTLTYYWCASSTLSSSITNFSAIKKDKGIALQWLTANDSIDTKYYVQYSTDGKSFKETGAVDAADRGIYDYLYTSTAAAGGEKMYFRIRQQDASGKSSYSAIRIMEPTNTSLLIIYAYPNPASQSLTLNLNQSVSGNYSFELINTSGQVVYADKLKLLNSTLIYVNWNRNLPSGMYFVKLTDLINMKSHLKKVIVQ